MMVRKNEVRKTVRTDSEVTESMQIAAAATLQANIIIGHLRDNPDTRGQRDVLLELRKL